ncbi:MAG: RDD family protein [Candidatus Limnocylindrales bacterium]
MAGDQSGPGLEASADGGEFGAPPAGAAGVVPDWYPRSGFRNPIGYEPDRSEWTDDPDVTRWYTSSEGGLSRGAINPPGFGSQIGYGGFWARAAAMALDAAIVGALVVVSVFSGLGVLLIPIVVFVYFPFFWIRYGATLGMQACGLKIVRAVDGEAIDWCTAAIRFAIFAAEVIVLPGFAVAAFERRKRAVHDLVAGTVVIQAQLISS